MAQPTVPASTKLRIKLKGVPRVQSAPPKGSAQAVRASLQLQDLRAAVEAFSKQGVGGLPEGVLLDPWNEEAVLQAQQEVVPGLTAVQYPASSTVRVRKRRAAAPAEFSLAELGPQYVIWGRHKRQRSQHPKRLAKSSAQLSSSLQRVLGGGQQTSSQRGASAASKQPHQQQQQQPQRHSSAGPEQRKQRHQHQQQQQRQAPVQILPRPPSPRLDDDPLLLVSPPPFQLHHQQLPYIAPLDVQAAVEPSLLQMGPAGQLPSPMDVQASAGPQLLNSGATVAVPVASTEVQRQPDPAVQLAKPAAQALPEQAAVVEQQSEPAVDAAPSVPARVQQQEAKQQPEQRQEQPPPQRQPQTASQPEAAAVAKPVVEQQEQAPAPPAKPEAAPEAGKQQQAAVQAAPAARQQAPAPAPVSKAEQDARQQEQQAAASPAEVYTDGIATRLRRKKVAEQPEPASSQPPPKQPKQAKGKQKQQKQKQEASQEDSAPPAKKARTAEQSPAAAAGSKKDAAADAGSKSAAAKAAPAKAAPKGSAARGKAAAAAVEKKAAQAPVKAPAATAKGAGIAAAKGAAPVAVKAEAASPAKPAAGASKATPAAAKVHASAAVKQGAAGAAKGAAAAAVKLERAPGPVASGPAAAAAAAAAKPESPPSETSHQQPMAAAVPQHMQQLQPPLQSLVPQLPQEQTAVSRDRSQCSLQQPAESPAAAASAGAVGGLNAAGAAGAAGALGQLGGSAGPGAAGPMPQPKRHLLELEASAMTPAALALGNLVVPTVTFKSVLPERPVSSQEEAAQYLEGMFKEARHRKHQGDNRSKTGGWDVYALTLYARSALEFLRYWDATQRIHKQLQEAGKPADAIKRRLNALNSNGLLKQVSQLCTSALQNAGNCKGQDVQKQALRMLLERLCAICQLRHLHSQKEGLSQQANLLKGAASASASAASGSASSKAQRPGSGRPPARAVAAAAAAAAGGSSPKGKQAFNKRSPDDSNTSNQERVQLPGMLAAEQHSPGLAHGSSPGGGGGGPGGGSGAAAGSGAGASQERALMIAESTCAEHLSELLKITDGMHQTVMRMQQFLESPEVLADDDARGAALHISTLGLDAGMFSVPRVVAHAEAALVCIVRSGRRGMARTAS